LLLIHLDVALSVDTNLNESEAAFESEFHKLYGDKKSEDAAAKALAAAEKQVPMILSAFFLSLTI
jgi:hypothetical protein